MSSFPGFTLESWVEDQWQFWVQGRFHPQTAQNIKDNTGHDPWIITLEQFDHIVEYFEKHRDQVGYLLVEFDPEIQSWRDYAGSAFDFTDDAKKLAQNYVSQLYNKWFQETYWRDPSMEKQILETVFHSGGYKGYFPGLTTKEYNCHGLPLDFYNLGDVITFLCAQQHKAPNNADLLIHIGSAGDLDICYLREETLEEKAKREQELSRVQEEKRQAEIRQLQELLKKYPDVADTEFMLEKQRLQEQHKKEIKEAIAKTTSKVLDTIKDAMNSVNA